MTSLPREQRSRLILFGTPLLVMGVTALYAWSSASDTASRLEDAREELRDMQRMAADISRLKDRPRIASLEMESPDEISNRVTGALNQNSIRGARLKSLDPQQPERVGQTDYQERSTEIQLENVTLPELATFAEGLMATGQGLQVRDVILAEPDRAGTKSGTETWLATVIVTQIIYSPR